MLCVPRSLTRHLLFYRCCSRTPTLSTSSKGRLAHFWRPSHSCRDRGYGSCQDKNPSRQMNKPSASVLTSNPARVFIG